MCFLKLFLNALTRRSICLLNLLSSVRVGWTLFVVIVSLHHAICRELFHQIDAMASEANHYIDDYADKIVTKRELQTRWKSTLGCQETHRW